MPAKGALYKAAVVMGVALLVALALSGCSTGIEITPTAMEPTAISVATLPPTPTAQLPTETSEPPTPTTAPTPEPGTSTSAPTATPGSVHWSRAGLAGNNITDMALLPQGLNIVLAASPKGAWTSQYDYTNWQSLNVRFTANGRKSEVAIGSPDVMYLTNHTGCASGAPIETLWSGDGGKSWQPASVQAFSIAAANGPIAYGLTCSGASKTTDGGATWAELSGAHMTNYDPQSAAASPDGQTVFVAYASEGGTGRIQGSTDGGATWKGMTPLNAPDTGIGPLSNLIYVAGSEGRPQDAGLYMTSNQGLWFLPAGTTNWKLMKKDTSGGDYQASALFVDTAYTEEYNKPGPVIYEARSRPGASGDVGLGVFRSTDGGATWQSVGQGLGAVVSALALAPRDTDANPSMVETLIAATADGIWTLPMPPPFR